MISYKQKKFLKSTAWNLGGMIVAFLLDTLATNLGVFDLSPEATAILGVMISRLTKIINTEISERKE